MRNDKRSRPLLSTIASEPRPVAARRGVEEGTEEGGEVLKIETRLDPTEINGKEVKGLPVEADQVIISAHWNVNRWVVIDFHGRTVTVVADKLERAIRNAINHD